MIIDGASALSRSWSSLLTRLGSGVLVLACIVQLGFLPDFGASSDALSPTRQVANSVALLALALVSASVLGACAVTIGSIEYGEKYSAAANVNRMHKIGSLGNPLLAEYLRDSTNKYELASGMMGVILLSAFLVLMAAIGAWWEDPSVFANVPVSTAGAISFPAVVGAIAALLFSRLVRVSATQGMDALDKLIEDLDETEMANDP